MSDALKEFIQKNRAGFKEKPSDDLWKKIDAALKEKNNFNNPKNRSAMLKYGFGASVIVAGTFMLMNLQKEKAQTFQLKNEKNMETTVKIPASVQAHKDVFALAPAKKAKTVQNLQNAADSLAKEPMDTTIAIIAPESTPAVLYAVHPPVRDSLDINNWPCAGSHRKKYSLSADHASGKTIGCIKSVSKKINGFVTMMQSNVPDKYLGKRVRVTGYVRTENVAEWAGLWTRVGIKGGNEALAFDNMRYGTKDRSIKGTTERTEYEIVLDVPLNSANIIYGVMLVGTGQIWFDSFTLEIVDGSVPVTGCNPNELNLSKAEKSKSYSPDNFWKWYVTGRTISKDGTWNINLEPNNF